MSSRNFPPAMRSPATMRAVANHVFNALGLRAVSCRTHSAKHCPRIQRRQHLSREACAMKTADTRPACLQKLLEFPRQCVQTRDLPHALRGLRRPFHRKEQSGREDRRERGLHGQNRSPQLTKTPRIKLSESSTVEFTTFDGSAHQPLQCCFHKAFSKINPRRCCV